MPEAIRNEASFRMLQSFAAWTEWLTKTGRTAGDFAEGLQECTKHVMSAPHVPYERGPKRESLSVARLFLRFLQERGLLPQTAGIDSLACSSPLLREFHSWMLEQRGVTRMTLDVYQRVLEEFIATVGSDPHAYSPQVLREFVLTRGARHGSSYAKLGATAVRSYLRFLGATGRCKSWIGVRPACLCFSKTVNDTKVSRVRRRRSSHCFVFDRRNGTARQSHNPAPCPSRAPCR